MNPVPAVPDRQPVLPDGAFDGGDARHQQHLHQQQVRGDQPGQPAERHERVRPAREVTEAAPGDPPVRDERQTGADRGGADPPDRGVGAGGAGVDRRDGRCGGHVEQGGHVDVPVLPVPVPVPRAVEPSPVAAGSRRPHRTSAVVAVLARRPRETGGACRVAPGRGVSDRVAPGPTHREQPRRRSGEQPGAAEVAAARRGRRRAAQGNRRRQDRPGPGRVVRGRKGHAVGDGLVVRSRCGRAVVHGFACSPRPLIVDGGLVPRRDVLRRDGRGGRLPAGSAVSRVVVAHGSPSVSAFRVGASAGWSR